MFDECFPLWFPPIAVRKLACFFFFFLHLILVFQSFGGNLLLAESVWSSIRIAFDLNGNRNFALVWKISIVLINKLKSFSQAKSFFHPNQPAKSFMFHFQQNKLTFVVKSADEI